MEKLLSKKKQWILFFIFGILLLQSCGDNSSIEFKIKKEGNLKSITSVIEVKSYGLVCNPKSTSTILMTLSDNSEYAAEGLNAAEMATLLTLFNSGKVQYDIEKKEFRSQNNL